MEFKILENSVIYGATEQVLAEITFQETESGLFCINHTVVDSSLKGQGIGGKLVEMAVQEIERRGGRVTATCSFAKAWIEKHPEAINR